MTGTQFVTGNDTERQAKLMYYNTVTCDWKAELKLTPAEREQALRAPHSKVDIERHWIQEMINGWQKQHNN